MRSNPEIYGFKINQELIHWSVGAQVKGKITEIKGNTITTEHEGVIWGNDTFYHTYITINDKGGSIPHIIQKI